MKIPQITLQKKALRLSISTIALCSVLSFPAFSMFHQKQSPGQGEDDFQDPRHYPIEKDWERDSVASRAFSDKKGPSLKKPVPKGDIANDENELWESASQQSNSGFGSTQGQKLTEIKDLKKCFSKGCLEITPENYQALGQYAEIYATAFKTYDKGVIIKGWKASLDFEPLLDLLHAFEKVKIFKADIKWDTDEDASETLARAIQFYEDLAELHLPRCKLTDETMIDIMESIAAPEKLKILDVQGNSLKKSTLERLKKHFPSLASFKCDKDLSEPQTLIPSLTNLTISPQSSGEKKQEPSLFSPISTQEIRNPSVLPSASTTLSINASNLPFSFEEWRKGLQANLQSWAKVLLEQFTSRDVTRLYLREKQIGDEGAKSLAEILPQSKITYLDLDSNRIGGGGAKSLATGLPQSKITWLSLINNQVGDEGAKSLAEILPQSKITYLDLKSNQIGVESIKTLSATLPQSKLAWLYLNDNQIGAEGAKILAVVLPYSQIVNLELYSNRIGDEGAKALAAVLPQSKITTLSIHTNQIGDAGAKALAVVLPHSQLTSLILGSNQVGDGGAKALAIVLPQSKITILYLDYNQMRDEGAKALAQALPQSKITYLEVYGNQIGDAGKNAIEMARKQSATGVRVRY